MNPGAPQSRSIPPTTGARAVLLRDGAVAVIREILAHDREGLLALHEALSPGTLYLRFFSASKLSASRYVNQLVRPGTSDHGGLVLEAQGQLIGVAAYECLKPFDPDQSPDQAEAAFVVADDQHGRGIGTLLLEQLATLARRRGVTHFVAETLPQNAAMLGVFQEAGYDVAFKRSMDTVHVSIDLKPGLNLLRAADRRERGATRASLQPLLRPRSVAVVGASSRRHTLGAALVRNIVRGGFAGEIYAINPRLAKQSRRNTVQGLPALASLTDLPGPVDLVVVAVPAAAVLGIVDECAAVGAKAMVIISAGFADAGVEGASLQLELREKARKAGIRVVGPHCLGVISTADEGTLAATVTANLPLAGHVGILTQSGGLGVALLDHIERAGIGLSSFVSVGNKIDVSGNDLLSWWDDDPSTDIAVLYLESFGNPRKFARFARHLSIRKPVVAIKAGRSVAGARAVQPHAASGVAPARSVAALFRQAGVINVDHVGELIDIVTLLSTQPLPAGPRLAIVGNAGGPGVLAADAASEWGLVVPPLTEATQVELRRMLPPAAIVGNPVVTNATAAGRQFGAAVTAVLADPNIDALLAVITPTPLTQPAELTESLAVAAAGSVKPVLLTRVGSASVTGLLATPTGPGIPAYAFPETAVRALARATEYQRFRERPTGTVPQFSDIRRSDARDVIAAALLELPDGGWVDPLRVEKLLAAYGITSLLPGRVVTSRVGAGRAATELGLPVALKAVGPSLVHKSDVGGVVLGLGTVKEVRAAFTAMKTTIGEPMTAALIQPMAARGVETIIGVTSDPSFGPLVKFGLGGTWAELLDDQAFRLVPLTDVDAGELIRSVRAGQLLEGYRGAPRCDVDAVIELLLRVGQLADDNPELIELDLNPVVATARGVTVLDAKARLAPLPE